MSKSLEGRAQKIISRMKSEGNLKNISKRSSYELDHKLAMAFRSVKENYLLKEKNSRYSINQIERTTYQN
jgi:hypothetical protein